MGDSAHGNREPKFLEQVANACRVKHLAYRTEQSYVAWIRRFILFHNKRHPRDMGATEVRKFLTHLAVHRGLAASTQNQALNAIVFMYREVLRREPAEFGGFQHAKRPKRLASLLNAKRPAGTAALDPMVRAKVRYLMICRRVFMVIARKLLWHPQHG